MAGTLTDVRERCVLQDGHWLWRGAMSGGQPRIYGPNLALDGAMSGQPGRRVVWQMRTGKPVPDAWRVFVTCTEPKCLNPDHIACESPAVRGAKVAASGVYKGQVRRIAANRATNRGKTTLTRELVDLIRTSPKTGLQLTAETGVNRTTISRIRTGKATAFEPVGGMFTGLLAMGGAS